MNPDEVKSNVTRFLVGALGYCAGRYHLSGDQVLAIASDGGMGAAFLYGVYSHWNMKKVSETAKVIGGALIAFLLLMPAAGYAADMPRKAPVNPFTGYVNGQCGAYGGINTMGAAGAINGGPPGASIIQGDIGLTLGYGCPIGTSPGSFWFVDLNFDWANINGSSSGLSMTGPAHFEQRVALGSPISSVLNLFPNNPFGGIAVPSLPLCPTNVTCGSQYPFIFASLHEQDIGAQLPVALSQGREWLVSPGIGLGLESRWSNGVVADVTAQWKLDSNGLAIGPQKVSLGNAAVVGVTFKY